MKGRIFISCGQSTAIERTIAGKLSANLQALGFDTYIAITAQNIQEINSGIIGELKNSDFFLLINFCREQLEPGGSYRGSLYSNQELAMAYVLGFDKILVIDQVGVKPEGILAYFMQNAPKFTSDADCVPSVMQAVKQAAWNSSYSRRLEAKNPRFLPGLAYNDLRGHFGYFDVHNYKKDISAIETTARLSRIGPSLDHLSESPIRSPLKASGRPGFVHTIFPKSHEVFDALVVGQSDVFLNCSLDVSPRQPLPFRQSKDPYFLEYQIVAIGFPMLTIQLQFNWPEHGGPSLELISQSCD